MFTSRWPQGLLLTAAALLGGCDTLPMWMVAQGRSQITDYKHFDNATIARSNTPWVLPVVIPAPAQSTAAWRWPGDQNTAAVEAWSEAQGTVALVVLRRGQVVYEKYSNGYSRDSIGTSFSMAKSIVSALLGIAVADGRIGSVDDPVTRYLPELLANDARFGQITLRHLLQMRSGIAFDEGYRSPFSDAAHFYLTPDMRREVAKLRIASAPGQAYAYKSGDTQLLAMALQRAVGQPIAAYAQARLWQPMGAEFDASWSLDSAAKGQARAFCCFNARAIDYARFGQLMLQGGQRDGAVIVPEDWVRLSTAAQTLEGADDAAQRNIEQAGGARAAFYAWQWRRAPQAPSQPASASAPASAPAPAARLLAPGVDFYAQGLLGQFIYVAPDTQTVVVRLGSRGGDVFWPTWMGQLARLNPDPAVQASLHRLYAEGAAALVANQLDGAITAWRQYTALAPAQSAQAIQLRGYVTLLERESAQRFAKQAASKEQSRTAVRGDRLQVAVVPFRSSDAAAAGFNRAVVAMITNDLAKVPSLTVLEREKIDALLQELKLSGSGLVDPSQAVAQAQMLGAGTVVAGSVLNEAGPSGPGSGRYKINSAVSNVRDRSVTGTQEADGRQADFYLLEKRIVYGILQALEIKDIPPGVGKFHTRNWAAYAQFAAGLQLLSEDKFDAARKAFLNALAFDPGFDLAREAALGTPDRAASVDEIRAALRGEP